MNEEKEAEKTNALADQLIDFVKGDSELFHDEDGKGHAAFIWKGKRKICAIQSRDFKNYLSYLAWEQLQKALPRPLRDTILATLEAIAKFEGEEHQLHLRTAMQGKSLWYDLGDARAVKINAKGWEVVNRPPILFRSLYHQRPQCAPVKGGKMEELLPFLNLEKERYEQTKLLVLTYLPVALLPDIPRPLVALHGLQGSSKSTFSKVLKSLIDPSELEALTMPRTPEAMVQLLSHHFAVFFDNLSTLSEEQSDALCRASTGEAMSKRQLYTDDDDVIYRYRRAVGLNGISLIPGKPDLLDRCLIFELHQIAKKDRIDEDTFWEKFNEVKPRILGAMFTALSAAMAIRDKKDVEMKEKPRLADYAVWAARVSLAIGSTAEEFTKAYEDNTERQHDEVIDNSTIAQTVLEFMRDKNDVRLPVDAMFKELQKVAQDMQLAMDREFPRSTKWLWRKLKMIQPSLTAVGINVSYIKNTRPRQIEIRQVKVDGNVDHENKTEKIPLF